MKWQFILKDKSYFTGQQTKHSYLLQSLGYESIFDGYFHLTNYRNDRHMATDLFTIWQWSHFKNQETSVKNLCLAEVFSLQHSIMNNANKKITGLQKCFMNVDRSCETKDFKTGSFKWNYHIQKEKGHFLTFCNRPFWRWHYLKVFRRVN